MARSKGTGHPVIYKTSVRAEDVRVCLECTKAESGSTFYHFRCGGRIRAKTRAKISGFVKRYGTEETEDEGKLSNDKIQATHGL